MIVCFQHILVQLNIEHFLHKVIQTAAHTEKRWQFQLREVKVLKDAKDFVTILQRKQRNLEKLISITWKFYTDFILVFF